MSQDRGTKKSNQKQESITDFVGKMDKGKGNPAKRHASVLDDSPKTDKSLADLKKFIQTEGEKTRQSTNTALEKLKEELKAEMEEMRKANEEKLAQIMERVRELEEHVNEKDQEIERLRSAEKDWEKERSHLLKVTEEAEARGRIYSLVFSGPAVPPAPTAGAAALYPAPAPDPAAAPADAAGGMAEAPGAAAGRGRDPPEDVEATIIRVIKEKMNIDVRRDDIDRAHRLAGGRKIIVRFVRSGSSSVRGRIYANRIPKPGRGEGDSSPKLFVNESLTLQRQEIFQKLLGLKRGGKIFTTFTSRGDVFVKLIRFGANIRVNTASAYDALLKDISS